MEDKTINKAIKVIGLTGMYCAGKNHVAKLIERRSLPVLDVDKLGYTVIENEKERLTARFGDGILGMDGLVDRKLLGARVFGRNEELAALENIIHPAVNRETIDWINAREEKACVINAALLHRSSAFTILDALIIVEAPFLVRLVRAKKRDKLSWRALLKRFGSQSNFNTQYLEGKTDIYKVSNPSCCVGSGFFRKGSNSSRKKLEDRIEEILSPLVND